ncbi:hypothetical protein N781_00090 [Pontibacillus halophilus JSM 076056 = DSM 19796]|uniref:Uncharacterized protein n=1 Tax=Pontibacillus halophilus JSM 076056 = DSM 19796 TaxID=1385510 RepID=A0A0A5GQ19_9BACI|nr:YabP/YqfC family sporulation protein [Pontibacillus halophilus]KGX94039.1 hypothetical protein N781_00090 [Pontibacillus halophilus JSM 076056 = DSM 19796]
MAKICSNCECLPYTALCECPTQQGITVIQPACQTLPDGSVTGNPCYRPSPENRSYWSYKVMTDNATATEAVDAFIIPICQAILDDSILVKEKVDGCGDFDNVPFQLAQTNPVFGTAPEGFQWLIVNNNGRYGKGISVEYRLEVIGNFPNGVQPISTLAGDSPLTFDCEGCYIVPQCPEPADLVVDIECTRTIVNNQATLLYRADITNVGGSPATDVQVTDLILYNDLNVTIGQITVTGADLQVDRATSGEIRVFGQLGTLNPGQHVVFNITAPISSIKSAGSISFNNRLEAVAEETQGSDNCVLNVPAVRLRGSKCCRIESSNLIRYEITLSSIGNSPGTLVNTEDKLAIPEGVRFQIVEFDNCELFFGNSEQPVPLNTPLEGAETLTTRCDNVPVPQFGSLTGSITIEVLSADFGEVSRIIRNTLNSVVPSVPDNQVYLGAENIPVSVDTVLETQLVCQNPCPDNQRTS